MKIGNKVIGEKPYIIAEFGMNHNGSLELAKRGVIEAAKAGADAIKFQTYTADDLVVKGTPKFWDYKEDDGKDQHQAYNDLKHLTWDEYKELFAFCEENNIEFLSTPFSIEAADKLNELGMRAFKIASSDMSTFPLLRHVAKFGKPILLSTGASTEDEIYQSVMEINRAGNKDVVVLHCVLCYPTKPEDANLNMMTKLLATYPHVGISDHTLGVFPSVIAIAKGAQVVEKHFTVDKTLLGNADHWLSVNPEELKEIVCMAKDINLLSGKDKREPIECEKETRTFDKRSWVSKVDIQAGQRLSEDKLTWKRPGTGIWPNVDITGKVALQNIPKDTTIQWSMIH